MTNSPDNAQPAPRPVTTAEHDVLMAAARDGMTLVSKGRLVATPTAQAAPAAGAVAGPGVTVGPVGLEWLIAEINKLPSVRAAEIDGEESDGTPRHWRDRSHVSLGKLERLLREFFTPPPADAAPTPAAQADSVLEDAALLHYALADGGNQSMNWQDVYDDWNGEGYFIDALRAAYKQDAARKQGRQT